MALLPLISNFQYDFVLQLLPVDDASTMDQVAEAAAYHSLNRRVKAQPGRTLRVRLQGDEQPFPREQTLAAAGVTPMACIEVYYE